MALFGKLESGVEKAKNSNLAHRVKEAKIVSKVADGGKAVGGFIVDNSKRIGTKLDEKIMQNEKLARAKQATIQSANKTGKAIGSGVATLLTKVGLKKGVSIEE